MRKYDAILFDLDGTLSRSADGIRRCMELAMNDMNKPCPDLSDYSLYIGPPLISTFCGLCALEKADAQKAVEIYTKHYDKIGVEENYLFDGMEKVLKTLQKSGVKLAVCSSKNERLAKEVVRHLCIEKYFDRVCGSQLDGTKKEKEELIPYAAESLNVPMSHRVAMVGDTGFDAKGAQACSVDFVGVTYGYGTLDDMKRYGGAVFVDSAEQLLKFLL